jgi:hypothetical protein
MDWRSASALFSFLLSYQAFMLNQVAESRRTRRVKERFRGFASVSAAFGLAGPIHLGNPG